MILRVIFFIIIVIIVTIIIFMFVKDLGENRRRIDKSTKEAIIKNSNQNLWKQGPKRKR